MFGEITRVDQFKRSRNEGDIFIRVTFKMEDGGWAKTDIVPTFRNYWRWRKLLRVGNTLFNLTLKDPETVDADSKPYLLEGRRKDTNLELEKLARLGVF